MVFVDLNGCRIALFLLIIIVVLNEFVISYFTIVGVEKDEEYIIKQSLLRKRLSQI
jgi:hypothetical protein